MNRQNIAVICVSPAGETVARRVADAIGAERLPLASLTGAETFVRYGAWVFVGAMGICVRTVAPYIKDKHTDPAVVCLDAAGRWAVPVLSGHVGGANDLAARLAEVLGGEAVLTTQSDVAGLWPLDTLGARFGWKTEAVGASMNEIMARFVGGRRTALLVGVRDRGAHHLEATAPPHVAVCCKAEELPADAELVIALSARAVTHDAPVLRFIPPALTLGVGCRRGADPAGAADEVARTLEAEGWLPEAVAAIATVELKKDEPLIAALAARFGAKLKIYPAGELAAVDVPNPSEKALEATGSPSVAEAAARLAANGGALVIEKRKRALSAGNDFTFAVAEDALTARRGHIEIVGAGPGDPDLVSVRGRRLIEQADLVLYAGSLVPRRVVDYARPSATVRSSADMTLEAQFELMKTFYDRGGLVVRLHTGDPCIYGAIQEQMNFFDRHGMGYRITPGISSFQAAAAELRSQFTIPERVQTIVLTRGGGSGDSKARTPMPEREQLRELARSQSTMCIFLSAAIADEVQAQLLEHYPPATPVAVCHRLTWPDQRIWRGELQDLAAIVTNNNLTLTTMIVVGEAIGNRSGLSRLYAHEFKHLFRK